MKVPVAIDLMGPVVKAMLDLGGSGTVSQIYNKVIENENIPDSVVQVKKASGKGTKFYTNLGYAGKDLREAGFAENPKRGVWSLTKKGKETPISQIRRKS